MANRKIMGFIFLSCAYLFCFSKVYASRTLDAHLNDLIKKQGLTGNPQHQEKLPNINTSPIAKLGKELFFSKSLSLDFDIACASCHHPELAGGDGLSLPVGVGAIDSDHIGPGRLHNGDYRIDPEADGGPNVERNSPSTFNTAFYQHALFYDGRVETRVWKEGAYIPQRSIKKTENHYNNQEQRSLEDKRFFKTPDSLFRGVDTLAGDSLLQAQARFPVVAAAEMRGFTSHFGGNNAVRVYLEKRFQGKTGELKNTTWEHAFRTAFNAPEKALETLITVEHITLALAEYQRSQVFINTPWKAYLSGKGGMSEDAKRGAILFFSSAKEGGANCAACHSGDFFTNENYYNLALPQFGRGNFVYGQDLGRHPITRADEDLYAFRVPTLLNVKETAPYGHTGAFTDLPSIIKHHFSPKSSLDTYDFTLQHLPQFKGLGVQYPEAKKNTFTALKNQNQNREETVPPLTDNNVSDIIEFLKTLTDPCVLNKECLKPWVPAGKSPDNHRLIAKITHRFDNSQKVVAKNKGFSQIKQQVVSPLVTENKESTNEFIVTGDYQPVCTVVDEKKKGQGFTNVTIESQMNIDRQFDFTRLKPSLSDDGLVVMEHLLFSGGVAAGDINGDCFPDLVINQGNNQGGKVLINTGQGFFRQAEDNWGLDLSLDITAPMLVDFNGDGWPDLFHGNIYGSGPGILLNDGRRFVRVTRPGFRVGHVTLGAGFGDVNGDGYLDAFLAHWARPAKAEEEHLWLNQGNGYFVPGARQFGLTGHFGERDFTFTPNFPDLNNDGLPDLLSTADFMTSQVFINQSNSRFVNVTDKQVITDQNGMGAAIADFDNDGDLDWFVTSIYSDHGQEEESNSGYMAGLDNGNRLYRNDGYSKHSVTLTDITDSAGVKKGGWGWGACAADFNNDGWVDIFQTNGFPLDPALVRKDLHYLFPVLGIGGFHSVLPFDSYQAFRQSIDVELSNSQQDDLESLYYIGKQLDTLYLRGEELDNKAKLFLNNQDGTFTERAEYFGIADPGQGRGISCLDYDRDGDIDVLIINNQGKPALYRNDFGNDNHFLTVKLQGKAPNTQGVGSKIYIETASGTQIREVRVDNNYMSQNPVESHFGLGSDRVVNKLIVVWPDGSEEKRESINADQVVMLNKYLSNEEE